jgi:hypothetical protein
VPKKFLGNFAARFRVQPSGSIFALFSKPLNFSSLTLDLGLIGVHLPLLIALLDFLALHLVADQRAPAETQRSSDGGTRARVTYCRADNPTGGRAAERANARALFTCRQAPAGTADGCTEDQNACQRD